MTETASRYGHNIGRVEKDYPDFHFTGDAEGYIARQRKADGTTPAPGKSDIRASSLDALAAAMDRRRTQNVRGMMRAPGNG